jgi:hypothetical protein
MKGTPLFALTMSNALHPSSIDSYDPPTHTFDGSEIEPSFVLPKLLFAKTVVYKLF